MQQALCARAPMSPQAAYAAAARLGCFDAPYGAYEFPEGDARPCSEPHRQWCLAIAEDAYERARAAQSPVDLGALRDSVRLLAFFRAAPFRPITGDLFNEV